ncbi:MAG: phage integrase SAM-like domain-containing protein [Paludibacter sp.]
MSQCRSQEDIADLKAAILKALETIDKADINTLWLENEIDKYYNPKKYKPVVAAEEKPITLFEFIEDFLKNAPQRKVSKSGTLMNKDAIVQHQITFDYLKKFAVYKKKTKFDFSDMNKSFYDEFVKYMQSKDLASNTIGQKIKHLKLWLNESYKLELHTEVKYKTAFEGMQEKSDNVALDEIELQKLFDLDFSNEKTEAAYKYKTLISDKLDKRQRSIKKRSKNLPIDTGANFGIYRRLFGESTGKHRFFALGYLQHRDRIVQTWQNGHPKPDTAKFCTDGSINRPLQPELIIEKMDKLLTVCRAAQGNKYTNAINIKGEYLKKYGFEQGDFVKVSVTKNKITIEKNVDTGLLTCMGTKNPALLQMIEGLSLTL